MTRALLTLSIGPVHGFIAQARRVADQWAASTLLSRLVGTGIETVWAEGGEMVFPYVATGEEIPPGLPNRFVCEVDRGRVEEIARAVEGAIRGEWRGWVAKAAGEWMGTLGQEIDPDIWMPEEPAQTDPFLDVAWSWVPLEPDYPTAMKKGAELFAASRRYRPFAQRQELWEKCALCGERTSLPNGNRQDLRTVWPEAYERAAKRGLGAYFREKQGRLCLVCLTKRLYPWLAEKRGTLQFGAFDAIGTSSEKEAEPFPYFALVSMDGDRMGRVLTWGAEKIVGGRLRDFHRELSQALLDFAGELRQEGSPALAMDALGVKTAENPQLVYAGGEDVVFYCAPQDAFPLARAVRQKYLEHMRTLAGRLTKPAELDDLTISAAVLFAHVRRPAGRSFGDVQRLLDGKAKQEMGRNAIALRLDKRSGPPVEAAFKWSDGLPAKLAELSQAVRDRRLASRTTYRFTDEEEVLTHVFGQDEALWRAWLTRRLSVSGEVEEGDVANVAELLVPFLAREKPQPQALRIARFLGREVP